MLDIFYTWLKRFSCFRPVTLAFHAVCVCVCISLQSAGGEDSVCVVSEERRHTDRQTRSVSSTSSCSASSSRPPSTIDSMLRKMREAEKLKAADEANRKAMSPYPYTCVSPTEKSTRQQKTKDSNTSPFCYTPTEKSALQNKGRELVSRSLSSAGLSSRSCTSGSGAEDVEIDEDLPSKYVSLGLPSLETTIENIDERSDGEMFDKDSVEVVERCLSSDSVDSISHEISHFRPIRACPLTPPRKLPSGKIVETPLIRTTPRNLNKTEFGSPVRTLSDLDASSPIMQRRLSELEEERKSNVNKLSKSTCTEAKNSKKSKTKTGSCDLDEKSTEKNQKGDRHHLPAVIDLEKDNEVKENQDSLPSKTGKHTVGQEKSEGNKYQLKKLVIPLEPTFDEDDFDIPPMKENNPKSINSDSFVTLKNQSPVLTKTKSTSVPKKSRKVSGRTKPSFGSPQRTITDWIKRSQDCTGQNVFHIEASCRDDVDGEPVHKTLHGEPVKVSQSGDGPAKRGKKEQKVVKSYPKRVRKPYNPDPMWTSASRSGQDVGVDECSRDSINVSDVIEEEKEELSLPLKSKSKKRTASSVSEEKSKKRRKLTDKPTASSKLKLPSAKSKLKSVQNSRGKNSIFNFCTESNLKRVKEAIENNQCMQEDADFRVSDDSGVDKMTQEMLDRKLAEELAKQYEMEVKTGFRFFKLKGTSEEYNFRRKPKLSI